MGTQPSTGMKLETAVELRTASGGNSESFSIRWLLFASVASQTDRKVQTHRCSHRVFGNPQYDAAWKCPCCQERHFLQREDELRLSGEADALAQLSSRSWLKIGIYIMGLMQVMWVQVVSLCNQEDQRISITPAHRQNCRLTMKEKN